MKRTKGLREKPGGKVAVVEEVADNIYSIKFILQSLGYKVSSFSAGMSYLEEISTFHPNLVIVDMMIPNRGGYQVIRRLRESAIADVPVLAITAEAMEGNEADVYEIGGQDVLTKPYTVSDLQEKLNKWLGND